MSKAQIPGFEDTSPGDNDPFEGTSGARQAERISRVAHDERKASEVSRRANDVIVDRKLTALHNHGIQLQNNIGALAGVVENLAGKVGAVDTRMAGMETSQKTNNDMTAKILTVVSGGKLIVGIIKFLGVVAVPATAIYTLWYVVTHGGAPPPTP